MKRNIIGFTKLIAALSFLVGAYFVWAGFGALIVVGSAAITATIFTGGAFAAFLATTGSMLQNELH